MRLAAGEHVLAYTGDTGPCADVVDLARGADLLLAEASYVDDVPAAARRYLSSAREAGREAREAGSRHLLLTHLLPGTDAAAAQAAAADGYGGDVGVAAPGTVMDLC